MSIAPPTPSPIASRRRPLAFLALLAVGAMVLGVASVLLLPAGGSLVSPGGPGSLGSTPKLGFWTVGYIAAAAMIGIILLFLYQLLAGPGGSVPKRFLSLLMVYFLVGIAFIALANLLPPGGGFGENGAAGSNNTGDNNGTGNLGLGNFTNLTGNITTGSPPVPHAFWYGVLAAIFIGLGGMFVAAWYMGRQHLLPPSKAAPASVGAELQQALDELDATGDSRAVLIALYGRLLQRVDVNLPNLEVATPREIERACVQVLHLPAGASAELRTLFERARYSTLPLSAEDVRRARAALTEALASLSTHWAGRA